MKQHSITLNFSSIDGTKSFVIDHKSSVKFIEQLIKIYPIESLLLVTGTGSFRLDRVCYVVADDESNVANFYQHTSRALQWDNDDPICSIVLSNPIRLFLDQIGAKIGILMWTNQMVTSYKYFFHDSKYVFHSDEIRRTAFEHIHDSSYTLDHLADSDWWVFVDQDNCLVLLFDPKNPSKDADVRFLLKNWDRWSIRSRHDFHPLRDFDSLKIPHSDYIHFCSSSPASLVMPVKPMVQDKPLFLALLQKMKLVVNHPLMVHLIQSLPPFGTQSSSIDTKIQLVINGSTKEKILPLMINNGSDESETIRYVSSTEIKKFNNDDPDLQWHNISSVLIGNNCINRINCDQYVLVIPSKNDPHFEDEIGLLYLKNRYLDPYDPPISLKNPMNLLFYHRFIRDSLDRFVVNPDEIVVQNGKWSLIDIPLNKNDPIHWRNFNELNESSIKWETGSIVDTKIDSLLVIWENPAYIYDSNGDRWMYPHGTLPGRGSPSYKLDDQSIQRYKEVMGHPPVPSIKSLTFNNDSTNVNFYIHEQERLFDDDDKSIKLNDEARLKDISLNQILILDNNIAQLDTERTKMIYLRDELINEINQKRPQYQSHLKLLKNIQPIQFIKRKTSLKGKEKWIIKGQCGIKIKFLVQEIPKFHLVHFCPNASFI